jgi:curved DNA-binding protein CbpA
VLGVADDAAPEEVQLAYRRLAKTWHPDVNPAPGAAARFRRVNAAYEILGDPSRRDAFDRGLLDDRARIVDDDVAFAPSARTRRAANERAYGGDGREEREKENVSARARARRRDGAPGGSDAAVAPMDEARRDRALRSMTAKKIVRLWTAWCRGWFAALQLGVPAACGYWILRATAAEELARRGAEDLAPWLARVGG